MFLSKLDQSKKELFLQLSIHAALANNILEREEEELISEYCIEMGINKYKIEIRTELNELLNQINKSCTEEEKNIIIFEIVGLLMADNEFDSFEAEFMNNVKTKLGISDEKLKMLFDLINKLKNIYAEITNVINV